MCFTLAGPFCFRKEFQIILSTLHSPLSSLLSQIPVLRCRRSRFESQMSISESISASSA